MSHERTVDSVALIGSFQHHYREVCSAWLAFSEAGFKVTTPMGTPIIEDGVPFVRFTSDPEDSSDPEIQTIALHRILRADFVFVVAPCGYVGKTTCYEIGRIIQAKRPLYFSQYPDDLPIHVPDEHVKSVPEIISLIQTNTFEPQAMYIAHDRNPHECDLLDGVYREDDYFKS